MASSTLRKSQQGSMSARVLLSLSKTTRCHQQKQNKTFINLTNFASHLKNFLQITYVSFSEPSNFNLGSLLTVTQKEREDKPNQRPLVVKTYIIELQKKLFVGLLRQIWVTVLRLPNYLLRLTGDIFGEIYFRNSKESFHGPCVYFMFLNMIRYFRLE